MFDIQPALTLAVQGTRHLLKTPPYLLLTMQWMLKATLMMKASCIPDLKFLVLDRLHTGVAKG